MSEQIGASAVESGVIPRAKTLWFLLLALLVGSAVQAGGEPSDTVTTAAPGCLDRSIEALQSRYERAKDLRARFVQTARAARLGGASQEPVRSSGWMVVEKPAKMRWTYEAPEESVVVSDGETLWIYDPAFGEAQRLPVGEGFLSGAAVSFLLGEGDLRRDFGISLLACSEARAELELLPRSPASYEKLRVISHPETGVLAYIAIHDVLGNVTEVELSDLETNVSPDPDTFVFVAPEGVNVVELDSPGR